MARVYATPADLDAFALPPDVEMPAEAEVARLLASASRKVTAATRCAVYRVDSAGLPVDVDIAEAMSDATCAQVVEWLVNGGEHGDGAADFQSVGIGSVNLARATTAPARPDGLAQTAADILDGVGLLFAAIST